jgi:hypothetical protein
MLAFAAVACVPEGPATVRDDVTLPEVDLSGPEPVLAERFTDDFERAELGPAWLALSPAWRLEGGELCAQGAKNRGVWLQKRLPHAARIELDAVAHDAEGDIKVELWGDGRSGATGESYSNATSYIAILGGWGNALHVLARLDEHDPKRLERSVRPGSGDPAAAPVDPGHRYRFKFERKQGNILVWTVDGQTLFELADDRPLSGPGHDHFGFNEWTARVCFDNLEIVPL